MKRLIGFGCSHMFGSEITGLNVVCAEEHNNLNFTSKLANHYGMLYVNAARPNNVNTSIVEDVYEIVRPGDVALVGWTYTGRSEYLNNGTPTSLEGGLLTPHIFEALASKTTYNFPRQTTDEELERLKFANKTVSDSTEELAEALARYYVEVGSHTFHRLHELLRSYMAVKSYCDANDVKVYQFFFDIEQDVLNMLNDNRNMLFTPYIKHKIRNEMGGQTCAQLRQPHFGKSKLVKAIRSDPNFFKFDRHLFSTLRVAASNRLGWNPRTWPNGQTHFDQAGNDACFEILREHLGQLI